MKLTKKQLSKLYKKNSQTRKRNSKGGKKALRSILKTKRRYERPLNLRYKTLRNAHKRKRDRRHNARKIRFQLKGGQENTTDKEIEMSEIKKGHTIAH